MTQAGTALHTTTPGTARATTVDATCASGYKVTGGGYEITDTVLGNILAVTTSKPSSTTVWRVVFASLETLTDHSVNVFAVCQQFQP